jgi:hypothetical protein
MDDMQAIEQRLAREMLRRAGPSELVDDAAIFAAINAMRSRRSRYQPMFGVMKYVVAGVIVALFGGFLVAGGLTTEPTDEPSAAVVAASASLRPVPTDAPTVEPDPTTEADEQADIQTREILPGVDLVTRVVEPGVQQVLKDGHRDLTVMLTPEPERRSTREDARRAATNLITGLDGSVWIFGPDESYRVGQPESHPVTDDTPSFPWLKAEVDPDGRLWTMVDSDAEQAELGTLRSSDGETWRTERENVVAFDLEQDGTVWVNADGRFIRLQDGWQTPQFARDVSDFWMSPVMHGTAVPGDEIEVLVESHESCLECGLTVWLLQEDGDTHGGPAGMVPAQLERVDMGDQGDHWIYQRLDVPRAGPGATDTVAPSDTIDYLVHVTGPTFMVYRQPDGVPVMGWSPGQVFRAGPDGSVWLTPQAASGCDGLANFDGEVWMRYLNGRCVYGFDIATDGTVWVQAALPHLQDDLEEPEPFPVDTFVIQPEVAASTR